MANVFNLVIVRMQNVDYKHNRNPFRAVKDLVVIDKHRAFYRGMFPFLMGSSFLHFYSSAMDVGRGDNIISHLAWPFIFLTGAVCAHPWFLLSFRV